MNISYYRIEFNLQADMKSTSSSTNMHCLHNAGW